MSQKLISQSYGDLEETLKKELPFSIQAYFPVKLLRKGLVTKRIVWVDNWPEFKTVVVSDDKKKNVSAQRAYCYCRNDTDCISILDSMLRHISETLSNSLFLYGKSYIYTICIS
ncbi:uncharacterized protein LOC130046857 [Ostrea edulis]|uniref:uncharacterized protein LOC130046857 n=1 Tax=Ostrea edulis TaxID=37623 RepID=UPI0024AFC855|nr:uncharacterized protein LOC130046857 [Ostrea edulis]